LPLELDILDCGTPDFGSR